MLETNVPVVAAFLAASTQWRLGPGGAVGLDYSSVKVALDALEMEITAELWRGLRVMESAVLEYLAERPER